MKSKDKTGISRRHFIVGVSAGVVGSTCSSKSDQPNPKPTIETPKASPKEAAAALCLILGPWDKSDRDYANDFLARFLTPERLAAFSDHRDAIATLPKSLPSPESGKLEKIPLDSLSTAEREACLHVLDSIYSIEEVWYYVAGEENAGTCMVDLSFIAEVP